MTDDRTEHLRAFLLGRLDDAAAAEVEARVFEDDAEAELVAAVEAELYDAYVLGELSADERARLEARGLAGPEGRRRLGVARALLEASAREARAASPLTEPAPAVATRPPPPPEPAPWLERLLAWLSPPRVAFGVALAAVLFLVLLPSAPPASTTLVPDTVRAAGDPVRASLGARVLRLELDLDGELPRASYRVSLLARGVERWRSEAVKAEGPAVPVDVPTAGLQPGLHTVRLEADGALLATYTLELVR